jgi:hypothetical protein
MADLSARLRFPAAWLLLSLVGALWGGTATEAAEADFRGQASGWCGVSRYRSEWAGHMGGDYIPQLTLGHGDWNHTFVDLEASLEAFSHMREGDRGDTSGLDLYRLKFRLVTPRTEWRLGLQQINFGPAYLLRSLRWFDRLDPRDPLGLTEGVYGMYFKYVTQSNAGLWLWALYGNDEPKGNEVLSSVEDRPEAGGRLEMPLPRGEGGVTFHRRTVELPAPLAGDFTENRFALDGRWDILIGLWVEAVLVSRRSTALPYEWRQMATFGIDYTFPLGDGLYALAEHMAAASSREALGWDEDSHISGLSLSYPLGYADRLSAIPFYFWDSRDYSFYAAWEHYWDMVTLNLRFTRYPDQRPSEGFPGGAGAEDDYEIRLLFIYNH